MKAKLIPQPVNHTHPQDTSIINTVYFSSPLFQYTLFSHHLLPLLIESALVKITNKSTLSNPRTRLHSLFIQPNTLSAVCHARLSIPFPWLSGVWFVGFPCASLAAPSSSSQPLDVGSVLSLLYSLQAPPCDSVLASGFNSTLMLKMPTRVLQFGSLLWP